MIIEISLKVSKGAKNPQNSHRIFLHVVECKFVHFAAALENKTNLIIYDLQVMCEFYFSREIN